MQRLITLDEQQVNNKEAFLQHFDFSDADLTPELRANDLPEF